MWTLCSVWLESWQLYHMPASRTPMTIPSTSATNLVCGPTDLSETNCPTAIECRRRQCRLLALLQILIGGELEGMI
jgi:hypothetical protein